MVFKLWSHRDYIYMDICKKKRKKEVYLWCVCHPEDYFSKLTDLIWVLNQFASPCLSGPSWWIIVGYHVGIFPGSVLFFCVHVSRCGNVYNTSNSCCSVFIIFVLFQCNVPFFFLWNMCLALWFWSDYNTVDGYVQYMGISLVVLLYLIYHHKKKICCPPTITNEMWYLKHKVIEPKHNPGTHKWHVSPICSSIMLEINTFSLNLSF